jgi:ADP-heptose:LPS heptosyltransferase
MGIQQLRRRAAQLGMRAITRTAADGHAAPPLSGDIFRVLICRSSHSLGNTLLITPLLREIEATWPGAEVDIVTRNAVAEEVFSGYASVRRGIALPRRGLRHPLALARGLRQLGRQEYDLAIDTDPRSQTGRALLLRSHARNKLGFAGGSKSGAISHSVDPSGAPRHNGQYPVHLLRAAAQQPQQAFPPLDLRLSQLEKDAGAQLLSRVAAKSDPARGQRGVVGIFANATGGKLLPRAWWQQFMPPIDAHLRDFRLIEIVPASAVSLLDSRYPCYYSSSVRKLAGVLSQLSLLVCLDGGIMHLARASGTPTAAIFAHTDIEEWGPYGEGAYPFDARHGSPLQAAQQVIEALPPERIASFGETVKRF